MNSLGNLGHRIEQYEAIIKCHEGTATKQIDDIWSSIQPGIDAAREIIRCQEAWIAQQEAVREAQKRDILSTVSKNTAPTRNLLADVKHQLAAISAPILRLPTECIAEIMKYFNVDNSIVDLLLVCKRWDTIAKATPRLWSKIVLIDGDSRCFLRLKGAHKCKSLEHLALILPLAKDVPLDIELACTLFRGVLHQSWDLMTNPFDDFFFANFTNWPDEALRLLGAEGRSRRWSSLHITSWPGINQAPFTAINGPFDNLRSLSIQPLSGLSTTAYEPLVAAIIQGAPRLSSVDTKDVLIFSRAQGWKDRRFWRNIEYYHSLTACDDWSFLSWADHLKDLRLILWQPIRQNEPVLLPSLHTLRLSQSLPGVLDGFRLPALETLFLDNALFINMVAPQLIPVLSVTSLILTNCSDARIIRRFLAPALHHLHIACVNYPDRRVRSKAWQDTFTEAFDGLQFMPRLISLHLELPVNESHLLSALSQLPQIEELMIAPPCPLGAKFWTALTPRGVGNRKKSQRCCTNLRILIVEIKWWLCGTAKSLSKARTLELAIKMATSREQEGRPLTHLLFSWGDGIPDEVLGSFRTLPVRPLPNPDITLNTFFQY
jgi:F-box-like